MSNDDLPTPEPPMSISLTRRSYYLIIPDKLIMIWIN